MNYMGQEVRPQPLVIAAISGYEFAAIASGGRIPTITNLLKRRTVWERAAVLLGVVAWGLLHFEIVVLPSGRVEVHFEV